ncbi:hypothetical protein [Trichloromonas sp.]|uniref:hypothetical protein n=1 Tax=Trichloromonas sp. TaxID=3069249 RepID=UPI002A3E49B0|nr:hypothetical protein [Trichloromonas sp.]
MKNKIREEVLKVFDQKESVDQVVENIIDLIRNEKDFTSDDMKNFASKCIILGHRGMTPDKLLDEFIERDLPPNNNKIDEDIPLLIGYLNRNFGYNGFKPIEIGTPVYLHKDRYYFNMEPINGGQSVIQKFYKDTLHNYIDFIDKL